MMFNRKCNPITWLTGAVVASLLLTGCRTWQEQPFSALQPVNERVGGIIVIAEPGQFRTIRFEEPFISDWREAALFVTEGESDASGTVTGQIERSYPYAQIESVLVRRVNGKLTALLVGGVTLGIAGIVWASADRIQIYE